MHRENRFGKQTSSFRTVLMRKTHSEILQATKRLEYFLIVDNIEDKQRLILKDKIKYPEALFHCHNLELEAKYYMIKKLP